MLTLAWDPRPMLVLARGLLPISAPARGLPLPPPAPMRGPVPLPSAPRRT